MKAKFTALAFLGVFYGSVASSQIIVPSSDDNLIEVPISETVEIDRHGICRRITNSGITFSFIVPTRSPEEWSEGNLSFLNSPPLIASIEDCLTAPVPNVEGFFITPFVDVFGVPTFTDVFSNQVIVSGFTDTIPVSISLNNSSRFRINGGAWVTSGDVSDGDMIELRHVSSGTNNGVVTTNIQIGGFSGNWSSTASSNHANCSFSSFGAGGATGSDNFRGIIPNDTVKVRLFDGSGARQFERDANAPIQETISIGFPPVNVSCLPNGPVPVWINNFSSSPVTAAESEFSLATNEAQLLGLSVNGSPPSMGVLFNRSTDVLELAYRASNGTSFSSYSININGSLIRGMSRMNAFNISHALMHPTTVGQPINGLLASDSFSSRFATVAGSGSPIVIQGRTLSSEQFYAGTGARSIDEFDLWPITITEPLRIRTLRSYTPFHNGNCSTTFPCETTQMSISTNGGSTWSAWLNEGTERDVNPGDLVQLRIRTGGTSGGTGRTSMNAQIVTSDFSNILLDVGVSWANIPASPNAFPNTIASWGETITSQEMVVGIPTGGIIVNNRRCSTTSISAFNIPFGYTNTSLVLNGNSVGIGNTQICNGDILQIRTTLPSSPGANPSRFTLNSGSGWTQKTWDVTGGQPLTGGQFVDGSSPSSGVVTFSGFAPNSSVNFRLDLDGAFSNTRIGANGSFTPFRFSSPVETSFNADGSGNINVQIATNSSSRVVHTLRLTASDGRTITRVWTQN